MDANTCRRVVLVVLDGLRPEAIDTFHLSHVQALEATGASTRTAQTVAPSVTAAAMGSLLTGVTPEMHGLTSDRFHIPRSREPIHPLPAVLRDAGLMTSTFIAQLPFLYRRLGRALAERLGVQAPHFVGTNAEEIASAAAATLRTQRSGLIVIHLADADREGHVHGWMSPEYGRAACALDAALGAISGLALDDAAGETLLIACADHGGGGAVFNDHESDHRLDRTIPIMLAGANVRAGAQIGAASLLDIPATILSALGVSAPAEYCGRSLLEAIAVCAKAA